MTEKIHQDSQLCTQSELDVFSVPVTNYSLDHGSWSSYAPVGTLSQNAPIEFYIAGGEEHLDLSKTLLHLEVELVSSTGAPLLNTAPINNMMQSMMEQVDLYLNDQLVTSANSLYAYRAILEDLLNYSEEAKKSFLTGQLFYKDHRGAFQEISDDNSGFKQRKVFMNDYDLIGNLHLDLFHQNRYLLNNTNVRIKMVRSKPAFCIMSSDAGGASLKINSATLYVRKVRLNNSALMAQMQMLNKTNARYPVNRVDMKHFTISSGLVSVTRENLFTGQLPQRVIVVLVDSQALNGDFRKNPFLFHHYDLNYIVLIQNSRQVPSQPLCPDFANGTYMRTYHNTLQAVGAWGRDRGIGISREDFGNGYTIFAFDLTPELDACADAFQPIAQGNVKIEMRFKKPLPHPVTAVVLSEFDSLIELTKSRQVIFDYMT